MTKGKPRERKLRPREQQAIDAQKILAHLTRDGSLWDSAACAGTAMPDAWFPEMNRLTNDDLILTDMALRTCQGCTISDKCLQVGMQGDDIKYGIFGGLLAGERLALRHKLSGVKLWETDKQQISSARIVRARIEKMRVGNYDYAE
jgi:hypothetical protein